MSSNNVRIICGVCNFPNYLHDNASREQYVFICDRHPDTINPNRDDFEFSTNNTSTIVCDYYMNAVDVYTALREFNNHWSYRDGIAAYADSMRNVFLLPDPEGTEARLVRGGLIMDGVALDRDLVGIGSDDEDDPNNLRHHREMTSVDNWHDGTYTNTRDGQSWTSTTVLGQEPGEVMLSQAATGQRSAKYVSDEPQFISHNAYVEGFDGFTTKLELDLTKTLKHHERILNVYRKNGRLRIGSVEITYNTDESVSATCVRNDCECKQVPLTTKLDIEPEDMQRFIYAVIAHGNNHAAAWFTNRPSFYKVHMDWCDLDKCDSMSYACSHQRSDYGKVTQKDLQMLMEAVNVYS